MTAPIVILADTPEGGAGRAAWRLFTALRERGANVEFWHFQDTPPDQTRVRRLESPGKRPTAERLLKNLSREAARKMRRRRHTESLLAAIGQFNPRLLHLHNLSASGLDHASLLQLPADLPIVWTLHDAWAFSPEPFRWHDAGLGSDERLLSGEAELSRALAKREKFFATRRCLLLAAPSHWLGEQARAAVPHEIPLRRVPYGLPTQIFSPLPKIQARNELLLDPQTRGIGFGGWAGDRRKGADILAAALPSLRDIPHAGLLVWGGTSSAIWPDGFTRHEWGRVNDLQAVRRLYAACEVFVCPSRADNFPLVVLEAQACGTPVIASDAGGTPESVLPGQTGWVVRADDPAALATALRTALNADLPKMSLAAAANGVTYSLEREAAAYEAIYAEMREGRA